MKKLKLKTIFIVYKSIWINFLDHHKKGKKERRFLYAIFSRLWIVLIKLLRIHILFIIGYMGYIGRIVFLFYIRYIPRCIFHKLLRIKLRNLSIPVKCYYRIALSITNVRPKIGSHKYKHY